MRNLLAGLLILLSTSMAGAGAPGIINSYVGVCDPDFPLRCLQPNADGSIDITGSITAETSAVATAAAPSYVEGSTNPLSMDLAGGLRITGTINATSAATATAAAPSYVEGTSDPLSQNLTGDLRTIAKQSGTWNIGTVTTVSTVTAITGGSTAHDAAAAAINPLLVGGYASAAAPTSVSADGDAVDAWFLRNGAQATVVTAAGALIGGDAANGLDVDVTRVTGTVTISGSVTQGTSPWIVAGGGTAGSSGTAVLTIQGIASGTAVPISAASGTIASGAVASGAFASGSIASGAFASGSIAVGAIAAGATAIAENEDVGSASADRGVKMLVIQRATPADTAADLDYSFPQMSAGRLWNSSIVTDVVPGVAATNLGKAEDAAAASADTGIFNLGVRNETLTAPTNTDGDYSQFSVDNSGRTLIVEAPTAAMSRGTATITASTSDTSIVAASGSASLKTYIRSCQIANTGGSTTLVTFKDGSGGSTLGFTIAPTLGGSNINFPIPLVTTANTAFYAAGATSTSSLYISCQGYKAP